MDSGGARRDRSSINPDTIRCISSQGWFMGKPGNTGLRRVVNATLFSLAGLRTAWRDEAAFRQELLLCIVLIPVGVWLGRTAVERSLLIGSCLIVLIVELLNTGLENVVDRVGQEPHRLSGQAKDLGSAAVFVSLVLVLVVWGLIAWSRFGTGS
jgi:diacylglycerol kinase (ATP)